MLHVEPPLRPEGDALYVHTFSELDDREFRRPPVAVPHLQHQMEESSYLTFCRSVSDDYEWQQSREGRMGYVEWFVTEHRNERNGYFFEYLRPRSFDLSAAKPPPIYQDLLLYKQLTADYSWMGVTATVTWALNLLLPDPSFDGNLRTFNENLKVYALKLWSTKIPFDGDSPVVDQTEEEPDWGDKFYVEHDLLPHYTPPVPALSFRVIAFDLFGTIIDGDGVVNDVMFLLLPTHPGRPRLSELENAEAPYTDMVQHVLEDVRTFVGAPLSRAVLREAVRTILHPGLYADAEAAVKTLLDQGYILVCLPVPDAKSSSLPQLPFDLTANDQPAPLSDLFGQISSMFSDIWGRCHLACSNVKSTQILVVTSSHYRVMEPANMADFPTVLVQRPGGLGSGVNLRTCDPTLAIDGLRALPTKLHEVLSDLGPSLLTRAMISETQYRVYGMYQVTKLLGMGSFGNVSSAFHVLTGSEAAIKL
ncbi:uncharacterized protein EDB91DRAFT_1076828 [Suillus paluster]|uniref:uncharacterized protein n=1 Tax=Suillus paluster TaxID=48578 RepID=UPI001B866AB8|nr:uncharacterized protein EDB91DRAFT_1076828 [Suillus paluster]KAG1754711.1 hypothetical protein EDB91DRAFT_1076828 [Suillus paluster]